MNDFLPQGYETPETPSHYMELEEYSVPRKLDSWLR